MNRDLPDLTRESALDCSADREKVCSGATSTPNDESEEEDVFPNKSNILWGAEETARIRLAAAVIRGEEEEEDGERSLIFFFCRESRIGDLPSCFWNRLGML